MSESYKKDFYIILGVSPSADAKGIRDAFRALAKRYHPDKIGPEGDEHFKNILEAYRVLSDSERKRAYDEALLRGRSRRIAEKSRRPFPPPCDDRTSAFRRGSKNLLHGMAGRGVDFEVILSPAEASRGALAEIPVPTTRPCFRCGGSGEDWFFACFHCAGKGFVREEVAACIRIPPGVKDGSLFELTLARKPGAGTVRIFIRVKPHDPKEDVS